MSNIAYLSNYRSRGSGRSRPVDATTVNYAMKLERPLNLGLPDSNVLGSRPVTSAPRSPMPPIGAGVRNALRSVWKSIALSLQRRRLRSLIGRLVDTALATNRDDFHVFVSFSAHVELLEVRVFDQGWSKTAAPTYVYSGRLPNRGRSGVTPAQLTAVIRLIKSMSAARKRSL